MIRKPLISIVFLRISLLQIRYKCMANAQTKHCAIIVGTINYQSPASSRVEIIWKNLGFTVGTQDSLVTA